MNEKKGHLLVSGVARKLTMNKKQINQEVYWSIYNKKHSIINDQQTW